MRIHLNLPSASPSSSSTPTDASSSTLRSAAPAPLTALTPNGELILIELQGALEIENQSPSGGQQLGTISFEPTRPDRPVLMISHHRLEGKFVNLVKPLAVLEKKVRPSSVLMEVGNGKRRAEDGVLSVKKAKRAGTGEEVGYGGRSSSPPVSPRRSREALDFSSSPPRQTPIKSRAARGTELRDIDEIREAREEADEEEEEEGEEPQTAVYYDVVNVIKRKILFSKRPEPIVRLDTPVKQA